MRRVDGGARDRSDSRNNWNRYFRNPGKRIRCRGRTAQSEKGVSVLIEAARLVLEADPQARS